MIKVKNLNKTFKTFERGNSFKESIKNIVKRDVKEVKAVKNVCFNIEKGELVGFLGPNGAGKSTTLKMLTGILFPTSGEVEILGYVPWKNRRKYVAHIGAVFGQKSQLILDIPPNDAFYLNKSIYSIPEKEFNERLGFMCKLLNVEDVAKKPTRHLSLGERMKCEFIMAMLHGPKIVFLDEPTIGLDVIAKEKIRDFITEMNKMGTTFILTTHDLGDIEHLAKRIILINNGEIVFDDCIEKLKRLLGDSRIINLSTHKPLPELKREGITVKKIKTKFDAELELDLTKMKLNKFIEYVNAQSVIKDLMINDIPIESIIKELYKDK